jgi:transcriptional regulator with XRE-family HTH domain
MSSISERIEQCRKASKYSQNELAKKMDMPQSNYSRMVKKGNDIPVSFVLSVAKILKINAAKILVDYNQMTPLDVAGLNILSSDNESYNIVQEKPNIYSGNEQDDDIINPPVTYRDEFLELTVLYWIHDYLKEILQLFDHDLNKDSLFLNNPEQIESLIQLLLKNVAYRIVSATISNLLHQILSSFFKNRTLGIFYYSKKDNLVMIELITEDRRSIRGFEKSHPEL